MSVSRRTFLGTSAAAVLAAGTLASKNVFGANDRIRVGCVGLHGRGRSHIAAFSDLAGSEVTALCDVDRKVLEEQAGRLRRRTGKQPKTYVDMRDLLADGSVDAVSFATPNHWHTLGAIWACQAGKDVYVEKPLSHNLWEGRQLVEAAARYGRVVQHGAQRRSDPEWIRAIQRMREGVIGKVYMARALCFKARGSIGHKPDGPAPDGLDWDLWQGPAPARPFNPNYVHYNWHWFWAYGNGDLGNQGVHQMDVAVWGLDKGFPVRVSSSGGRFGYEDQGETPNTQICTYTYGDGTLLVFEVRGLPTNDEGGARVGNLFYGSEGYMIEREFFDTKGRPIRDVGRAAAPRAGRRGTRAAPSPPPTVRGTGNHYETFLRAVRSRKPEDIAGSALDGHLSSGHCHLGNIAFRVGRDLTFDPTTERFVGEFSGEANVLLSREYREGFEVPRLI